MTMSSVCPQDVKKVFNRQARDVAGKRRVTQHGYRVLKDGVWVEPLKALLKGVKGGRPIMSMLPGSSSLKVVGSRKEGTTQACLTQRCAKVAKRRKGQKSTGCTTALRGKKYGIKSSRRRDSGSRKVKHQGEDEKEVIFNGEEVGIREDH